MPQKCVSSLPKLHIEGEKSANFGQMLCKLYIRSGRKMLFLAIVSILDTDLEIYDQGVFGNKFKGI